MIDYRKLRWRIADLAEKYLPRQCWSDLVEWVYYRWRDDPDLRTALPWRPMGSTCRDDFARVGSCYCGKLRQSPAEGEVASDDAW